MKRSTIIFVAVVLSTGIVAAQAGTSLVLEEGRMSDDFEDGDIQEWDNLDDRQLKTTDNFSNSGAYSLTNGLHESTVNDALLSTNETFTFDTSSNYVIRYYIRTEINGGVEPNFRVDLAEADGTNLTRVERSDDGYAVAGSGIEGKTFNEPVPDGQFQKVELIVNHADGTATLEVDDTEIGFTNLTDVIEQDEYQVDVRVDLTQLSAGESFQVWFDDIEIIGTIRTLEVDANAFMQPGASQNYEVILNETEVGTGAVSKTDVTDETNVTSANPSIIQVNEADNELIANDSAAESVNVTFEYQGTEQNVSIFVGGLTIDNIEDIPSAYWVPAFFGMGQEGTAYGMGSDIQWVFVFLLLGSSFGAMARNEWVAIGCIVFFMIFGWVMDFVPLGLMLVAVMYGLFAGMKLQEVPSRTIIYRNEPKQ